ncbi:MAG TPA: manganese efflux pump, partial [Candidatus Baltobacteraceae bacterium]|nr:manganese efflux pump [Candidatus Baltobacteraceae bacterium]
MAAFVKVLIVAVALALDVFAVSVGVGVRGVPRKTKIRIGIAFASAEIVMNLVGAGLGIAAGKLIGHFAGYIGFAALIGLGIYMMRESRSELSEGAKLDLSQGFGLLLAAVSISLD